MRGFGKVILLTLLSPSLIWTQVTTSPAIPVQIHWRTSMAGGPRPDLRLGAASPKHPVHFVHEFTHQAKGLRPKNRPNGNMGWTSSLDRLIGGLSDVF